MTSLRTEFLLISISFVLLTNGGDPIGTGGPSFVREGRDALLTCVVTTPFLNNTVLWRRGTNEILTAGINRVTKDGRFQILHDENHKTNTGYGGDVWVLLIKNTKLSDSDVYTCEVNSDPIVRSFQTLTVQSSEIVSSEDIPSKSFKSSEKGSSFDLQHLSHDFTHCCEIHNITDKCIGFCNIHNIIDGTIGIEPELCEKDLPTIVKCMADGRNHAPCCEEKRIPDLCQDMCRGEYSPQTDLLKTRVSCVQYTLLTLQCILQGIQNLPSPPIDVYVGTIDETSLEVGWSPPETLAETVKFYTINLTDLHSFDPDKLLSKKTSPTVNVNVSGDMYNYIATDLKPLTMYSVTVTSHNNAGESLPSQKIRALTYKTEDSLDKRRKNSTIVPILPNIRNCCESSGMTHRMCLDKMCDPKKVGLASLPDFMVCAPWSNITFKCLANDIDHSSCCRARGLPADCLPLCSGKKMTLNFVFFKCLRFMPDYSSCLLQGYGVLPGFPVRLRLLEVASTFAILDWSPPKVHTDTVIQYILFYRKIGIDNEYTSVRKERPPLILEDLDPESYYEWYVVASNSHGSGMPSSRLVFLTKIQDSLDEVSSYNISKCCQTSGVSSHCIHLCSYNIKLSDIQNIESNCKKQMAIIVKCASAGRDHVPCCTKRGVTPLCVSVCRGVLPTAAECLSYAGNILQCLEEGSENIPGPVEDVHITYTTNNSIVVEWLPPSDIYMNTTLEYEYIVQYGKVDNMTMYETVVKLENETHTNTTFLKLNGLEPNSMYRILVITSGKQGTSLPSSMILVNTSHFNDLRVPMLTYGVPSPPHSLQVSAHGANWIGILWQPPEYSHLLENISYRVFHKQTLLTNYSVVKTSNIWVRLDNLKPNSQHIIYVEALSLKGASLASETLVAWTDPALPAFVETPTVQPFDIIQEGGSMTVLCLALGNPAPTVSLYVGGHLVRQDTSRHMVTVIHNVTTDMVHISCYADNGYGIPMQATRRIKISYAPRVQASGITVANIGDNVDLKCTVLSVPPPKIMFWRDKEGRVPVIQGGNYDISVKSNGSDPAQYVMNLKIITFQASDVGDYFCHAENVLGFATSPVSLRIRSRPLLRNISECCVKQNISSPCMTACSFYIDIDAVINKPECIVDFDKLMKCASDGSDHRKCCADNKVPRKCLNWCRGEAVLNAEICSLQYTKTIIGCFETNRDKLPGPPQNVAVDVLSKNEVQIRWNPPSKNPNVVQGYRIFYHEANVLETIEEAINATEVKRVDVQNTIVSLSGLKNNVLYEVVVKAGNNFGASVLTDPLRFTISENGLNSKSHASTAGTVSGVVAGVIFIFLATLGVVIYKKRRSEVKVVNGVAFENPSYLRAIEQVQISTEPASPINETCTHSEDIHTDPVESSECYEDLNCRGPSPKMNFSKNTNRSSQQRTFVTNWPGLG